MRGKKCVLAMLVSLALLFCGVGCKGDEEKSDLPSKSQDGEVSRVEQSDNKHVFNFYGEGGMDIMLSLDQNGNEIPKEEQFTVLYDLINKEPQCQTKVKIEKVGEDPEYGYPIGKRLTALFDMDGNVIFDYDEVAYSQGFDDFVIRQRAGNGFDVVYDFDYDEKLINIKTGEEVLKGVGNLKVLDSEKKEFVAYDTAMHEILGVIDEDGKIISRPPQSDGKYIYPDVFEGMILAEEYTEDGDENVKPDTQRVLFSRDFEIMRSSPHLYQGYGQMKGDYLAETDADGHQRVIDKDFNVCYEFDTDGSGENLQYFDGELAVLNSRIGDDGKWEWVMRDKENKILAEKYAQILPIAEFESDEPSNSFIGVKSGEIHMLNRKGEVLFNKKAEACELVSYIGNGFISYGTYENVGLLDTELNEVIPFGKYSSIDRRYDGDYGVDFKRFDDILICRYFLYEENKGERIDLLNSDLKVIMSGASDICGISEDRLAVERGFSRGIIDYNGNWVKEYSIFDGFKAEDREQNIYW